MNRADSDECSRRLRIIAPFGASKGNRPWKGGPSFHPGCGAILGGSGWCRLFSLEQPHGHEAVSMCHAQPEEGRRPV